MEQESFWAGRCWTDPLRIGRSKLLQNNELIVERKKYLDL
jgi:hypothetical protein